MGSDLFVHIVEKPDNYSTVTRAIEEMATEDLLCIIDDIMPWYDDPEELREYIKGEWMSLARILESHGGHRRTYIITLSGQEYILTGGESWGDSPNEDWDMLTSLSHVGVL